MAETAVIREQMRLFAQVAEVYKAGIAFDAFSLDDPTSALSQFVRAYAYERQGRSPSYGPVASEVIRQEASRPDFWQDRDSVKRVWDAFAKTLKERAGSGLNHKNNPLCYKGCVYNEGNAKVNKLSVIELVQSEMQSQDHNIVLWAKEQLEADRTRQAHAALRRINGIGPKIASFFLRDVAWWFEAFPNYDRVLLQPIDTWVKRAVHALDQRAKGKEGEWIVQTSRELGVCPEAINTGMWYFGAQVAGNEYRLSLAIKSPDLARQLVDEYVERLDRKVRAWSLRARHLEGDGHVSAATRCHRIAGASPAGGVRVPGVRVDGE